MKGITPIIAIILLLMITIALVGAAFVFFSGSLEDTTNSTTTQIQQQTQALGEKFGVENVYASTGANNQVTVRNKGTNDIVVANNLKFYFDGKEVAPTSALPNAITMGTTETFTFDLTTEGFTIAPTKIKVTTAFNTVEVKTDKLLIV